MEVLLNRRILQHGVEDEAAARDGAFGLGQLRHVDRPDAEPGALEPLAGPRKGVGIDELAPGADDVRRGRLARIDVDQIERPNASRATQSALISSRSSASAVTADFRCRQPVTGTAWTR